MFSADELGNLQQLLSQLGLGNANGQSDKGNKQKKHDHKNNNKTTTNNSNYNKTGDNGNECPRLDPAQLLVIAGLLSGGLVVRSVWVNDDQTVQFVLTGNLKRKTQLERVMQQIGKLPFDQVIRAIMVNNT